MAGEVAPAYLLAGGDAFLEDYFVGEVARRYLPPGTKKMMYSLDDDRVDAVVAELSAFNLFQSRQLMVVLQAQRWVGAAREELLAYLKSPGSDKCLILLMEEHFPSKGLHRKLAKLIPVVDTRPPFPDKIRSWANYYAKLKGYQLETEALDQLMELAGDSVGHIVSELDKLFNQNDEGATIDSSQVKALVGADKSYYVWHLQETIAHRKTEDSLRILVSLLEYGTPAVQIVNALSALFCQLLFLQSQTTAEGVYTGLNKPVLSRLPTMRSKYDPVETSQILRRLMVADVHLKSTNIDARSVLIPLVAGICRGIQ